MQTPRQTIVSKLCFTTVIGGMEEYGLRHLSE
jgi:hypothetical protein